MGHLWVYEGGIHTGTLFRRGADGVGFCADRALRVKCRLILVLFSGNIFSNPNIPGKMGEPGRRIAPAG
jgi:hypothetical protein